MKILIVTKDNRPGDEGDILSKRLKSIGLKAEYYSCSFNDFYQEGCKTQPDIVFIFDDYNILSIMRTLTGFQEEPFSFNPRVLVIGRKQRVPRISKKGYSNKSPERMLRFGILDISKEEDKFLRPILETFSPN
jgi:hypothetical protein